MENTYYYNTPIGKVGITSDEDSIVEVNFAENIKTKKASTVETPLIREAARQLDEYFEGKRERFDLPLKLKGTNFQKKVWKALEDIPYGQTRSYKEVAISVDSPKASRAVGGANNKNPISIIIPCHRVIGANGKLVGYGGGMEVKKYLLSLENDKY